MGQQKKNLTKTINFGEADNKARILVEDYIKKYGKKNKLSELVRRAVFLVLSDNPEHKDWKIKMLLYERKEVGKQISKLSDRKTYLDDEMRKLGYNPDDLLWGDV